MAVRIAHFSDVHLTAKPLGWRPRDFISKRITGWMNVQLLGRGRSFRHAVAATRALVSDLHSRQLDGAAFSGDATGLGFESEFAAATHALRVQESESLPVIAVPGNHDYYTRRSVRAGLFEQYFAPWLHGFRIEGETYPFARQIGDVWLIGVNSSTVNRWNWDASGAIGTSQLERLKRLCDKLPAGPRVLVTHYPLRTHQGLIEPRVHRLRDHAASLNCARESGIQLWLHGHIHRPFVLSSSGDLPFPVVCAGSATQTNRWSYSEYTFRDGAVEMLRRLYNSEQQQYLDSEFFSFELPT